MLPDVLALQYSRFCHLIIDSEIWRHIVTTEKGNTVTYQALTDHSTSYHGVQML